MISTDIANIADWIVSKAAQGESLGPQTCALIAQQLLDLSRQAAQLETRAVDGLLDEPKARRYVD